MKESNAVMSAKTKQITPEVLEEAIEWLDTETYCCHALASAIEGKPYSLTSFKADYRDWDAENVKTETVNVQTVKKPDTAVQMYKQGELDFANISQTSAIYNANKNNEDVIDIAEARADYLVYNETGSVEALTNEKIREALNLATDREGLVKAAADTGTNPATAFVPKGLATLTDGTDLDEFVSQPYTFDKEEAAKLLKEGLAELGVDSLTLTITADSDNPIKKAATYSIS